MGTEDVTRRTKPTLKVLLVEDSQTDAEAMLRALQTGGYEVMSERVQTAEDMRAALNREAWQLILSDYTLPSFSAPAALLIAQERHRALPFIVVSRTVGEETAVSALKAGAYDFLRKDRLTQLVPMVERELREAHQRQQREREREAMEIRSRQSQKLEGIGRLAGGIAHDFNNLLTAIIGYTEMVLEQIGTDKPISQDLAEIRNASDRAVALTRQLLAFSRTQTLHPTAVALNDIIQANCDMLRRLISEDIEMRLQLSPAVPAVLADRVQLEQVLMNLIMNARDAMPRGGVITIDTITAGPSEVPDVAPGSIPSKRFVRIRVGDTGIGMDEETRERIFEPFFTTKGIGEGTGLGLATVYGVVQQLGGYIVVASEVGHGTTFTLFLPEAPVGSMTAPVPTPQRSAAPLALHREIVLIVEDQRAVRQLACRILTRHGYTVLEAGDPADVLSWFDKDDAPKLDMVVSDVMMPTMSGPELVARLRVRQPALKVLYISGYSGDFLAGRTGLDSTTTFLEKPFTASILLQAVRDVLDQDAES